MHLFRSGGRIECEALRWNLFIHGDLHNLQIEPVVIAGPVDSNCARKRSHAVRGRGRSALARGTLQGPPVRQTDIRKENAFWPEGLQTSDLQVGTVKPDFPQDFRLVAAA